MLRVGTGRWHRSLSFVTSLVLIGAPKPTPPNSEKHQKRTSLSEVSADRHDHSALFLNNFVTLVSWAFIVLTYFIV